MSQRIASHTAFGTLFMRGVHQLLDAQPLILNDPVALALLGDDIIRRISETPDHHRTPAAKALRAHVVLRSRFAEDCLHQAVSRGVQQYVILGAGFDTFAYRQPSWASRLKIFEVDQPASQKSKMAKLEEARISVSSNVKFAGIDFERESLKDGLMRNGVLQNEPAFFSWLGVTMYLQEAATDAVLATIAEFPASSAVVFTFTQPPGPAESPEGRFHSSLSEVVSGVGEPFVSLFTPARIEEKLRSAGFRTITFLTGEEADQRYFLNRPNDLFVSARSSIVLASR